MGDLPNVAIGFPYRSFYGSEMGGAIEASTTFTVVTAGAAHTKGSWTQLIASTAEDSSGMVLIFFQAYFMIGLDVGVGAAGSETVLVPNVYTGSPGWAVPWWVYIPISVKKGTRISVRVQSVAGGNTIQMGVLMLKTNASAQIFPPVDYPSVAPTIGESAGFLTASTAGTLLTASASAHVKGSYAQLIASTAKRTVAMIVCAGNPSNTDTNYMIDIATGAAASEVVLISDLPLRYTLDGISVTTIPIMIPPGARIAARCQSDVGSRTVKIALVLLEVK